MTLLLLALACGTQAVPEAPAVPALPTVPTAAPPPAAAAPPAAPSVYDLSVRFVDQHGQAVAFDVDRGHPVLLSMFYSSCTTACPLLIGKLQAIDAALSPAARAALRVVLVSFDPEHDTPAALAQVAADHALDERWSLLHADAAVVQQVAAVLGFRYHQQPGGGFEHSTGITLVDPAGVVQLQLDGLGGPIDEMVATIAADVPG